MPLLALGCSPHSRGARELQGSPLRGVIMALRPAQSRAFSTNFLHTGDDTAAAAAVAAATGRRGSGLFRRGSGAEECLGHARPIPPPLNHIRRDAAEKHMAEDAQRAMEVAMAAAQAERSAAAVATLHLARDEPAGPAPTAGQRRGSCTSLS